MTCAAKLPVIASTFAFILTACATSGLQVPLPTATAPVSWARVIIPKPTHTGSPFPSALPTYTSTSTSIPTSIPTSTSTNTPPAVLAMKIVEDTPVPTYSAPNNSSNTTNSPQVNASGKYILVSISKQHLYAYDNGQLIYSFIASTGMGNSTRVGNFSVLDKIPNAYGANWDLWMPDWIGIYWSGNLENGIHALPILSGGTRLWAGYLGTPISFGCIVLGINEAHELYNWADVGTPVEIQP